MIEKRFIIYHNLILLKSENHRVLEALGKDFYFFETSEFKTEAAKKILSVDLFLAEKIPYEQIPELISCQQTRNAVVYENDKFRYCDYYQDGLVIYNKVENSAEIYCLDGEFLHELSYLFIMSKVGKQMDLQGFHRIHACAFKKRDTSVICMMPMKGGKSTLFLSILEDREVEYFSDDTPLIDHSGNIHPFPSRIGIKELPGHLKNKKEFVTDFKRKEFGIKKLIEIKAFENNVALNSKGKIVLIDCVRSMKRNGQLMKISKFKMLFPLFKYMGIGLGLPIIIEYFLENGIKGWLTNFNILFKRFIALAVLLLKAKTYRLYLGQDRSSNPKLVADIWNY